MPYQVRWLGTFVLCGAVLTGLALLGVREGLEPFLAESPRGEPLQQAVHAFLFERTPVQWCTLGVFFSVLTLLAHRMLRLRSVRSALRQIRAGRTHAAEVKEDLVRSRFEQVGACRQRHGERTAAACMDDLNRRDEEALEHLYVLLGSGVQIMLALGFFGTIWGISRSMFGAFGDLSTASPAELRQGLGSFTTALSIALDTTVLGMSCALVASVAMTGVRWAEVRILKELGQLMK